MAGQCLISYTVPLFLLSFGCLICTFVLCPQQVADKVARLRTRLAQWQVHTESPHPLTRTNTSVHSSSGHTDTPAGADAAVPEDRGVQVQGEGERAAWTKEGGGDERGAGQGLGAANLAIPAAHRRLAQTSSSAAKTPYIRDRCGVGEHRYLVTEESYISIRCLFWAAVPVGRTCRTGP